MGYDRCRKRAGSVPDPVLEVTRWVFRKSVIHVVKRDKKEENEVWNGCLHNPHMCACVCASVRACKNVGSETERALARSLLVLARREPGSSDH